MTRRLCLLAFAGIVACDSATSPPDTTPAAPGSITITATTTGLDFPTEFGVQIGNFPTDIKPNGILIVGQLKEGDYSVWLTFLPPNCTSPQLNPVPVTVRSGQTTPVQLDIQCTATYGALSLYVVTSGTDADASGYHVTIGNVREAVVGHTGTFVFDQLPAGTHRLGLYDIASNCSLLSETQSVTITAGKLKRDTATASFELQCSRVEKFAFRRTTSTRIGVYNGIVVAYADGSELIDVQSGLAPAWSPNGSTLALQWVECDFYYYFPCTRRGLIAFDPNASFFAKLTTDTTDADPSWRPTDAATIVFGRGGALYTTSIIGPVKAPVRLSLPAEVVKASQPEWSPDGSRIAFTCEITDGWSDICLVAPDGTGFARLTSDSARDANPTWSPDGDTVAFSTSEGTSVTQIALISTAGGAITPLVPGRNPSWSHDGTRLLFEGALTKGIFLYRFATKTAIQLTVGDDHDPTWRP